LVTDEQGRVYPNPARRLAPDFFFHPQVYRYDGESIDLAPGRYHVSVTRGPEYRETEKVLLVPKNAHEARFEVRLARFRRLLEQQAGQHPRRRKRSGPAGV